MFTGIVEELGTVRRVQRKSEGVTLEIQASEVPDGCEGWR